MPYRNLTGGGSGKSVPDYMNDDSFDIRNGCNAASSEAEFEKALRPGRFEGLDRKSVV